MINGIVGRPRTGKSYEATRYHIIPTILKDKRLVVTNIPVNKDYIEKVHGKEYADLVIVVDGQFSEYGQVKPFAHEEDFLKYKEWKNEKGQGALFVVDEVHLCCGSRNARPELLEYYSLHGHYGHDHLILTQNARKIHRDLKDMAEIVWRTTKLSAFGKDDTYLQKTYHGFDNLRDPVNTEERHYDKEWFPYYKSHTQSETSVTEATSKEIKASINPYKTVSIVTLSLGVLIICFLLGKVFLSDDENPTVKEIVNSENVDGVSPEKEPLNSLTGVNQGASVLPGTTTDNNEENQEFEKTDGKEIKLTVNEKQIKKMRAMSKQYHPFYKVQLHVSGHSSTSRGQFTHYFSASSNGQELFQITLKDLFLAGYSVQILSECVIEIQYFDYRDFLTCDVPTVGVSNLAYNG